MYFLLKIGMFHCFVSLPEGIVHEVCAVWRRLLDCGDQIWVEVRDVLFLEDVEWCFIRYFVEQELFFNCEYYTLRIQTLPDRVGLMIETSHPQNRNIGEIPFLGHIWILRDMVFLCFFPQKTQVLYNSKNAERLCPSSREPTWTNNYF